MALWAATVAVVLLAVVLSAGGAAAGSRGVKAAAHTAKKATLTHREVAVEVGDEYEYEFDLAKDQEDTDVEAAASSDASEVHASSIPNVTDSSDAIDDSVKVTLQSKTMCGELFGLTRSVCVCPFFFFFG